MLFLTFKKRALGGALPMRPVYKYNMQACLSYALLARGYRKSQRITRDR